MIFFSKNIIKTYLLRNALNYLVLVFTSLFLIIVTNHLFIVFSSTSSVNVSLKEIMELLFYRASRDIPLIINLSVVLSFALSMSRLYKNQEAVVMNFSGLGNIQIYKFLSPIIIISIFFQTLFLMEISPRSITFIQSFKEKVINNSNYLKLIEKQFNNLGEVIFYASSIDNSSNKEIYQDIFIFDEKKNDIIIAKSGIKTNNRETNSIQLMLSDGSLYKGLYSDKGPSISTFERYSLPVYNIVKPFNVNVETSAMTSLDLINKLNYEKYIELISRFNQIIMFLVVTFLAVSFSKDTSRKSTFGTVKTISIFFIYLTILSSIDNSIYIKNIEIVNAIILPHLPFLFLSFLIILKDLKARKYVITSIKKT